MISNRIVAAFCIASALSSIAPAAEISRSVSVPLRNQPAKSTPIDAGEVSIDAGEVSKAGPMTTQILTRFSRDAWGMSEAEWNRYLQLMRGIRGSVSQSNISPLEVLGIHAATDHERREYARRFAWMMKEDADRVLAFTRAYGEEAGKLNAGTDILDKALLQLNLSAPKARSIIQSGDRLLLFTRIDSCADCDRYLNAAAAAAAQTDTQLDIYVHDAKSDRDIRHWVESHPLDSARIQAKRITFNHHRGELTQLAGPMATIPKLIRLRGDSAVVVDPNRLMD